MRPGSVLFPVCFNKVIRAPAGLCNESDSRRCTEAGEAGGVAANGEILVHINKAELSLRQNAAERLQQEAAAAREVKLLFLFLSSSPLQLFPAHTHHGY